MAVSNSFLEVNQNLKLFKVCRDKTRSISDSITTPDINSYDQVIIEASNEYSKCLAIGETVKKEAADDPLSRYITEAVNTTQQRIKADQGILNLMKDLKPGEDNKMFTQNIQQMNFAVSYIKQQESTVWAELGIRKDSQGDFGGFTYFNIAGSIFVLLLIAKYFGKNKFTEERRNKKLEKVEEPGK